MFPAAIEGDAGATVMDCKTGGVTFSVTESVLHVPPQPAMVAEIKVLPVVLLFACANPELTVWLLMLAMAAFVEFQLTLAVKSCVLLSE